MIAIYLPEIGDDGSIAIRTTPATVQELDDLRAASQEDVIAGAMLDDGLTELNSDGLRTETLRSGNVVQTVPCRGCAGNVRIKVG